MVNSNYLKKLFFKQWVIGIATGDIREIIRKRKFTWNIEWIKPWSAAFFQADPFIIDHDKEFMTVIFEEFSLDMNYGNISYMVLDRNLKVLEKKILLDTGSHLSFPFVYNEEGKVFIVPESARSGKVSCYEFDKVQKKLTHCADLVDLPLYDPAVLKLNGKYWLTGSIYQDRSVYHLYVFYSDSLLGPYKPLPGNPVMKGLDGVRSAGGFIEVDGSLYRPAQNCSNTYGESITINKVLKLDENNFEEESYMLIEIDESNRREHNIHTIHTINVFGDRIIVDGLRWEFSMTKQINNFFRNRRLSKVLADK
ncbi:MAG TPA: hypothetical protein VK213_13905 [Bacteroidales bacterium]|nr:hypothetical protein [Bacteroidales bacterium]